MDQLDYHIQRLQNPNHKKRAQSALNLGNIGHKKAVDHLEKSLKDSHPLVRSHSIISLSKFKDSRIFKLLTASLNDENDKVYSCTASAISKIGNEESIHTLINEVIRNNDRRRSIATNNLIKIGKPAVQQITDAFNNSTGSIKANFLKALGKIGDEIHLDVLIDALNDESYQVFWVATAILRKHPTSEAVPALVSSLFHKYPLRQERAALALWHVGDERAALPLLNIATNKSKNERVRNAAISSLSKIGGVEVIPHLLEALNEKSESIKHSAIMGLSYIGDAKSAEIIVDTVNQHPEDSLYHNAIVYLGERGNEAMLKELERLLESGTQLDMRVKWSVEKSIAKLRQNGVDKSV